LTDTLFSVIFGLLKSSLTIKGEIMTEEVLQIVAYALLAVFLVIFFWTAWKDGREK
jgi:hypothetical protein